MTTTRLAAAVFALLVAATFAAFFVTQRLKRTPPVIQGFKATPVTSPNADSRKDVARISFRIKHTDDVTVAMVDHTGEIVRTLVTSRRLPVGTRLHLVWDGRNDDGARVPDGLYRARVGLRRQGRSVTVPRSIRLDVTPPRPVVTSVKPDIYPAPDGQPITVRFQGPKRVAPQFVVYRTDLHPERVVRTFTGKAGSASATWDGMLADGRPAAAGTYLIAVRVRDEAGNIGVGPAILPPRPGAVDGHPGITVRFVAALPPLEPVLAGAQTQFLVDARKLSYTWSIRRIGASGPRSSGTKTKSALSVHAPHGTSGLYLFSARHGDNLTQVPFAVQARGRPRSVLVVLPAITWQGRNPVDDDGDGIPNTLDNLVPARISRPFAGDGLPQGFTDREAPLLVFLDRNHHRYDLTTDLALLRGDGPKLEDHRGVLLAGDERWLPAGLQARLRRFVEQGGHVASVGIDSLRRGVGISPSGQRLFHPTAPAVRDVFSSRLRPLVRKRVDLSALNPPPDKVGLFATTDGSFPGFDAYEETADLGATSPGTLVAAAGPQQDQPVIVGYRLGKGLVIRFGLPQWTQRLRSDPNVSEVMQRTWTLISR